MQASTTSSLLQLAELEDQCRNWLLRIELDIHCGSLTLDAVQWALSALVAIQRLESLDDFIGPPDSGSDVPGESGASEQALVVSQTWSSLGTSIALLDINLSPEVGDIGLPPTSIGIERLEVRGKATDGAENGQTSDVAGEFQEKEESGEFMEDIENRDDEARLAEAIELADKGEGGDRLASAINDKLSTPGCLSLVKLIEHSLLLSLSQERPDKIAPFLNDLKHVGDEGAWLHAWLLKSVLSGSKLANSQEKRKHSGGCDMDWLLALSCAASPDVCLILLLDIVAAECFQPKPGKTFLLSLFVRTAAVLEFLFQSNGEHAALLFLSSYRLFEKKLNASTSEHVQSLDETYSRGRSRLSSFWLSLGALCPGLSSCCICLLVPTLDVTSVKQWWHVLQGWNLEEQSLLDISKVFLSTHSGELQRHRDWLCAMLMKRLAQLSPVAVDIILLLHRLCSHFVDQMDMGLSEAAYLLLDNLCLELCQNVFPKVSGLKVEDASEGAHSFMENLKLHFTRLWSAMAGQCVALYERQAQFASMKSVYEHPSVQICFLALLSSDAQAVAEVLIDSSLLIHSAAEEGKLSGKLVLLVNVMQILAGKAENQLIFELWGQGVADQLQMQHIDQAFTTAFAIKKLLELSSTKTYLSLSPPHRLEEESHVSEIDTWHPARYYILRALNEQWLSLVSLLHHDNAWELRLLTLDILQHLSPDKSSTYQEVVGRLKIVLGLFLWWLDKAYAIDASAKCHEKRCSYFSLIWTESDEKWQQIQLIEKIKGLIIQLASTKLMSFTLMANSLLDYSFQKMQGLLPESSVPRKFNRVSPMFASCISGRLNCYGRFEIPASKDCRSSANYHYHQEIQRKGSKDESTQKKINGVNRLGMLSQTSLIAAQLGNLLRRTIAEISRQVELPVKSETLPCQPSTVMANLIIDRLQIPHEVPMTKEQYEEVLPKVISASRHIFLVNCFSKNPLLFEMLELIVENSGENTTSQCIEFIRTLLAESISSWHNRNQIHKYLPSPSMQIKDEEADRVQVCRLIQMIATSGWLPKPLASSSEIISLIDGEDMSELLLLVWRYMHHTQETNAKSTSSMQVPHDMAEVSAKKDWEDQYFAILRKNVSKIGCHFSRVYPKGRI